MNPQQSKCSYYREVFLPHRNPFVFLIACCIVISLSIVLDYFFSFVVDLHLFSLFHRHISSTGDTGRNSRLISPTAAASETAPSMPPASCPNLPPDFNTAFSSKRCVFINDVFIHFQSHPNHHCHHLLLYIYSTSYTHYSLLSSWQDDLWCKIRLNNLSTGSSLLFTLVSDIGWEAVGNYSLK